LWQYNRKVKVGTYDRGGLPCGKNVWLNVTFASNTFALLDRPKVFYNATADSFNMKKLCHTFINEQIIYAQTTAKWRFSLNT